MKKAFAAALVVILALPLVAAEVSGVKLADRVTVEGKQLALNGAGLRSKMMIKVYVAGLYAEKPTRDAGQLIGSDQVKQVRMVMLRDLGRGKIVEAVESGFEKNNKAQMPALKQRLAGFVKQIPDLKEGQQLVITYVPGKGTVLNANGVDKMTVPGKDFADALFGVWLGKSPVDQTLKKGMLGA